MQAYSDDLRERVVAAYATGQYTIGQVASRFAVSVSLLLKRQRTSGSVAALSHRGGPAPRLQEVDRQRLIACVTAQPDATLAELGQQLVAPLWGRPCCGKHSSNSIYGAKKSLHAAERDTDRVRRLR